MQLAHLRAGKTSTVALAQRLSPRPAGEPGKQNGGAIQLTAATKKKLRKLRLSQREMPRGAFASQVNKLLKTVFMETGNDH